MSSTLQKTNAITDPMQDWQIAGLVFLLFKGGLTWLAGTYEKEGRANLQTYMDAATDNPGLLAYLRQVKNVMENDAASTDKPVQQAARNAHVAIRDLVKALNASVKWTYCGTIAPEQVVKIAGLDSGT